MIVVIPSSRSINLNYLSPLIDAGARFVVVDDSRGSIRVDHPRFEVYNWGDRERMLGPLDVGFPRRNGASRDFGFYVAWRNSDPGEVVVALDDDCSVYHHDFAERVTRALSSDPRPVADCPGTHLNILELYEGTPDRLYPRGFPYSARLAHAPMRLAPAESRNVTFCLGLWRGAFDINAVDKVHGPAYVHPNAQLKAPCVIAERGKLVSVCSMNMQFRRELIPAVYQLPMHVEIMPNAVVDRYGDIWGGFILKTLMDLRGEALAFGEPMIHHSRHAEYVRNTWQENLCHMLNDEFLALLAEVRQDIRQGSYLDMMRAVEEGFRRRAAQGSPLMGAYLQHMCTAMDAWITALS